MKHQLNGISIKQFVKWQQNKRLDLEPAFQRKSVWNNAQRKKFIESLIQDFPIPCIFLAKNKQQIVVLDGKQRLESIFHFLRLPKFRKMKSVPLQVSLVLGKEGKSCRYTYKELKNKAPKEEKKLLDYKIPCVEVTDASLTDLIDVFVRINTTGKQLSSAEKFHAKYFKSYFLSQAHELSRRWKNYLLSQEVMTENDLSRMKHVELVCELLASIQENRILDKKKQMERLVASVTNEKRAVNRAYKELNATFNLIRSVFPNLSNTRFHKVADFYTLVFLIWQFKRDNLCLHDKQINQVAQGLLQQFSTRVDNLSQTYKKLQVPKTQDALALGYLSTVHSNTDSKEQRRKREDILRQLLESLFKHKDQRRVFSTEQRRILWNTSQAKKCVSCGKELTWNDFTVDHILPYVKGGTTELSNAQLMCRRCNSRKGKR